MAQITMKSWCREHFVAQSSHIERSSFSLSVLQY